MREFAQLDLGDRPPGALIEIAASADLPFVSAFLDSVERQNAMPAGGSGRAYLQALLAQGSFEILSPLTGAVVRSGSSAVLIDTIGIGGQDVPFAKAFVFSVPDEPGVALCVGDVSLGYPICAAILFDRGLLLRVANTDWGFTLRHIPMLTGVMDRTGWHPGPAVQPLSLVVGDANFAHHAWNQLSGLDALADQGASVVQVIATHQPLGPVAALFPDMAGWSMQTQSEFQLEASNGPGRLFAPAGGVRLSRALVGRVLAAAERQATPESLALRDRLACADGPVLWLSVRTRNRTAVNQHALLLAVAEAFIERFPRAAIVIDGFSVAADLATYSRYHRDEAEVSTRLDRQAAAELGAALTGRRAGPPAGGVHIAVGLPVGDAILLAQQADVYFCHHGTIQHKIGWFSSTPGMVHSNRAVLEARPSEWVAAQSEVATTPAYLPVALVDDVAANATALSGLLRQDGYLINDIQATARAFMAFALGALSDFRCAAVSSP